MPSQLDIVVNNFFISVRQLWLTKIFMVITNFATPTNLTVVAFGLAIYFIFRHRWYFLALLPASLLSGVWSETFLKSETHVMRPLGSLVSTTDFSFPSGHATIAVIFCGLLAYYFKDEIHSKIGRQIYIYGCAFVALIVCVSRLYLGAHWFSDIIAGVALGLFWLVLYIVLFHLFIRFLPKRHKKK